jgi:hypothetical protein
VGRRPGRAPTAPAASACPCAAPGWAARADTGRLFLAVPTWLRNLRVRIIGSEYQNGRRMYCCMQDDQNGRKIVVLTQADMATYSNSFNKSKKLNSPRVPGDRLGHSLSPGTLGDIDLWFLNRYGKNHWNHSIKWGKNGANTLCYTKSNLKFMAKKVCKLVYIAYWLWGLIPRCYRVLFFQCAWKMNLTISIRVARFFLVRDTKTGKNVTNELKMYRMVKKYPKWRSS